MELEKDTLNALISYLKEHGYPPESFAIEFPIGRKGRYRVDLAILDPDTQEPIALFEVKQQRTTSTEDMGRRQLKSYLSALEVKSIPTYLVFLRVGTPPFEIIRVYITEDEITKSQEETKSAEIPTYETLTKSERNLSALVKKKAHKRQVDQFTAVSLILAAFVIGLLISDLTGKLTISATELTLLVIFIGLVLVPWASKIRFAGIEFERLRKKEDSKS
jgi:hypothetical protein